MSTCSTQISARVSCLRWQHAMPGPRRVRFSGSEARSGSTDEQG